MNQLPRNPEIDHSMQYDIAFIGSGLSSSYTLIHLIQRLRENPLQNKPSVLLLEKTDEFFTGIAYGSRTGHQSLMITSLENFLPADELEVFHGWLKTHWQCALQPFREQGGELSQAWFTKNQGAIEQGDWRQIFIPRYLFGLFLKDRVSTIVSAAQEDGILNFEKARATVNDISRLERGFQIDGICHDGTKMSSTAGKVVLAFGNPASRNLFAESGASDEHKMINDPYAVGAAANIPQALDSLKQFETSTNNVLVVGANASAIEIAYRIQDYGMDHINKVYVLSGQGSFPQPMMDPDVPTGFVPDCLHQLLESDVVTAKEIYLAAREDILRAEKDSIFIDHTFFSITQSVFQLLPRLDEHEQQQFACVYGVELGRLQRRAGKEYTDAVTTMEAAGKLQMVKGKFGGEIDRTDKGVRFSVLHGERSQQEDLPVRFRLAFNCTGNKRISEVDSMSLLRKLQDLKLCQPNPSDRGFKVNDQLECSDALFVIGPLLAGNIINQKMIWHAEHCGRIINFSKLLAEQLSATTQCDSCKVSEA